MSIMDKFTQYPKEGTFTIAEKDSEMVNIDDERNDLLLNSLVNELI